MDFDAAVWLVNGLSARADGPLEFEFSAYVNGPPGRTASRRIIRVGQEQVRELLESGLDHLLSDEEELGLNSRCRVGGLVRHIPMIDFVGRPSVTEVCRRLERFALEYGSEPMLLDSGRSFHCYFATIVSERAWHKHLAALLLSTPPTGEDQVLPVDIRWVGHSLENGFSCLRWTSKTSRYVKAPSRVSTGEHG